MRATTVTITIDPIVHAKCFGCDNRNWFKCRIYEQPKAQWTRIEGCAARSHNKLVQVDDPIRLNPLKASKRGVKQS